MAIGFPHIGPMLFGDFFAECDLRARGAGRAGHGRASGFTGGRLRAARPDACRRSGWRSPASVHRLVSCTSSGRTCPARSRGALRCRVRILEDKYGFDTVQRPVFAGGRAKLGHWLWRGGDAGVIDGVLVNGTGVRSAGSPRRVRAMQTGYLYHYAFAMIIGLLVLILLVLND
jgi:NADH-quinone oxidoreductase subunit L